MKQLRLIGLVTCVGLIGGCGSAGSDQQARDDIAKSRVESAKGDAGSSQAIQILQGAAGLTDATDTVSAQAKAALGDAQFNAAIDALRMVDRDQIRAARLTLDIAALARQLAVGGALIDGYRKGDPKSVRAAIDQKIADAQGAPDKPTWIASDKSQIPTLAAVTQNISKLEGEISSRQGQIKQLDEQRIGLIAQAGEAAKASESQTGQTSVDSFKKASDLRKTAADLATQIETVKAQIVPLQADLGVAQGQQAILNHAVAAFQRQSKELQDHWTTVQDQITAQQVLAKQIASGGGAAATQGSEGAVDTVGKSIAEKSAALAQLIAEIAKNRDSAVENLQASSSSFEQAFTAAQNARNRIETMRQNDWLKQNSEASFSAEMDAVNPMTYKLRRAAAEQALGETLTKYAADLTARLSLRELIVPAAAATGVTTPAELADANLEKQRKEALERAEEAFTSAENLLDDITGSGRTSTAQEKQTVRAAYLASIFARWGHMQTALLAGNADKARDLDQRSKEAVKQAAEAPVGEIFFPVLPGNLQASVPKPAPPAPPTTEPSTQPSDVPAPDPATAPSGGGA